MLILNSFDDIVNQGKWLYEQCYDRYSVGHCIILQGFLSLEWHRSFNLIKLEKDEKKQEYNKASIGKRWMREEVKKENGKKS